MDNSLVIIVYAIVYFFPAIVAYSKSHRQRDLIAVLNFLFGWTVVGWLICLGWAAGNAKDDPPLPSPETHVRCPDCAELVLRQAKVCKHCGCKLTPQ